MSLLSPDDWRGEDWASRVDAWSSVSAGLVSTGSVSTTNTAGKGVVKATPQDFVVEEIMDVLPTGEGEHIWLNITKTKQNTDQVAKRLARFCNVSYRDVGYSGLKDFFAVTTQWFSVWLPGGTMPDWSEFDTTDLVLNEITLSNRKIKRGTHRTNRFEIIIRDLNAEPADLEQVLERIRQQGAPNYFGPQRFGRNGNNMPQALELLNGQRKIKDRNLRSILLSSARSWLFNTLLDYRVKDGSWNRLMPNEPANLDGSASVFISQGGAAEEQRLASMDIHPTAAMWGDVDSNYVAQFAEFHQLESTIIEPYQELTAGLQRARLNYQRRATRMNVINLAWRFDQQNLVLEFELAKGQFATSVIREVLA